MVCRRGIARIVVALLATLAGIAVGVGPGGVAPAVAQAPGEVTTTFGCLGIPQEFVVPTGVTTIDGMVHYSDSGMGSTAEGCE
jgi:hypothetical protein